MNIDAFGKPCPMPLVMAKKELDAGNDALSVSVDNETAVKNLTRLGAKKGLSVAVEVIEGGWLVAFSPGDATSPLPDLSALKQVGVGNGTGSGSGYSVFIGKDHVGEGDADLGRNLMRMALYTLAEADDVPVSVLFMNSGVKLVAGDDPQATEHVKTLIEKGTEVLVCGTCLDFYGLKEALEVGDVSNMYDILERMKEAAKVITL